MLLKFKKKLSGSFPFVPPQLQSTCHYVVNHYVQKNISRAPGGANNMHALRWGGGTNRKDPTLDSKQSEAISF